MPIDLHLRSNIFPMTADLQSPSSVRRYFQLENVSNVPPEKFIEAVYDKFTKIGSMLDREWSGRPASTTEEVLSANSGINVRRVSQEIDRSKTVMHCTMHDVQVRNRIKCI